MCLCISRGRGTDGGIERWKGIEGAWWWRMETPLQAPLASPCSSSPEPWWCSPYHPPRPSPRTSAPPLQTPGAPLGHPPSLSRLSSYLPSLMSITSHVDVCSFYRASELMHFTIPPRHQPPVDPTRNQNETPDRGSPLRRISIDTPVMVRTTSLPSTVPSPRLECVASPSSMSSMHLPLILGLGLAEVTGQQATTIPLPPPPLDPARRDEILCVEALSGVDVDAFFPPRRLAAAPLHHLSFCFSWPQPTPPPASSPSLSLPQLPSHPTPSLPSCTRQQRRQQQQQHLSPCR